MKFIRNMALAQDSKAINAIKNIANCAQKHKILRTTLLVSALTYASLASAQGISGIGAFAPNTEMGFTPVAAAGEPRINWINGEYQETNKDLSVKVLGGTLDIARSWSQGRWWLNPAWAPLNFELDPLGADVKVIERVGVLYERSGQSDLYMAKSKGNAPVYIKKLVDATKPLAQQHTGWQWYDRFGNTITYDKDGRILNYANPSGVKVSFAYDSATSARILDHWGNTIYMVTMANGLITKVDDLSGRSVSYQWTGTQLTQVTDVMGNPWKYEYDGNGQITSRTDPIGFKTTVQYSQSIKAPEPMLALGKKGTTIDPAGTSGTTQKLANIWGGGRVGKFDGQSGCSATGANHYLREQRVFEITNTDCRGNSTVIIYDLQGNELNRTFNGKKTASNQWDGAYSQKYTNTRGYNTTTTYDTNYQPLQITHPDGSVEKYTYEPVFGRQISYTNQLGVVSTWSYDSKGNVTEWVEAKGSAEQRTHLYQYDGYGQLTMSSLGSGGGKGEDIRIEKMEYDTSGNVIAKTNPDASSKSIVYDLIGRPIKLINALGYESHAIFNKAGNIVRLINAEGQETNFKYDSIGRKVEIKSAQGNVQIFKYDNYGREIEVNAASSILEKGVKKEYSSDGLLMKIISPGGLVSSNNYNKQGRISDVTTPSGSVIKYTYGDLGAENAEALIEVASDNLKESYTYDANGNRTSITQNFAPTEKRVHKNAFDAMGRMVSTTDAASKTTIRSYDSLGRLITIEDPSGTMVKQEWNAFDELISIADSEGGGDFFVYNKNGKVIKETRSSGEVISYNYDKEGQLIERTDSSGGVRIFEYNRYGKLVVERTKAISGEEEQEVEYKYNKDGHLISYMQNSGDGGLISSADYSLDLLGRVNEYKVIYSDFLNSKKTFVYSYKQIYNSDGMISSQSYPDGSENIFVYENGLLVKVIAPNSDVIRFSDFISQLPTKTEAPNVNKVTEYDAFQRVLSINILNSSNSNLARRLYKYDYSGNIINVDTQHGGVKYSYDAKGQLTGAVGDAGMKSVGVLDENYSYDSKGNRVNLMDFDKWKYRDGNLLEKYPYYDSLSNKYYSTDLSYTKRSSLEYESNLIFERRYSYDVEGRLKNFESSGKIDDKKISAQYRYDPFGRRIGKLLSTSSGVKSIFYIYNRFGLLAESDENGAVTKAYAFNPTKAVAGTWSSEPLWQANVAKSDLRDSGSKYNYLHVDNLGAPILATDSDGFVAWETIYGAYGIPYIFLDNAEINLRYPGQYFDEESNSNYNFFRNYRYDIGRYIQADPIGVDGGLNLYSYANNNPLIYFDIFGLQALGCNDYVLGRPRIVTTEMPIEEHLYTLYIPGASYENPGAKAGGGHDPRLPTKPPISFGFDFYFIVTKSEYYNEQMYSITDVYQKFMRICRWKGKDNCGSEKMNESYEELPEKHIDNKKVKIGSPTLRIRNEIIFKFALQFL